MAHTKLVNLFLTITFAFYANLSQADSHDDLILALINKGVLTEEEAAPLLKDKLPIQDKVKDNNQVAAAYADGFFFQTLDQANQLALNGRMQFDSRNYGGLDEQNIDTFDIRRAYLTMRGKVHQYYDFNITADFAQSNSVLDQAYIGVNWFSNAKLRLGQFDMPFGLEHSTSDLFLEFQERSFNDAFAPSKERGFMVYGPISSSVHYGVALSSGRGKNANNQDSQVDDLELVARVSANLASVLSLQDSVYHLGLDYSHGDISANQKRGTSELSAGGFTATSAMTESRGITFFNAGKFSNALTHNPVERTRYGAEAAYARGPFKVQTEFFKQNYSGLNSENIAFDKDLTAWYVSAYWLITGESLANTYQQNGTWGRLNPNHDFSLNGGGLGALGLGVRFSSFNASDFSAGNGPGEIVAGSSTTGAHAWTAGLRWMLTSHTHLVANYVFTKFNEPLDVKNTAGKKIGSSNQEKAITLRAQVDF